MRHEISFLRGGAIGVRSCGLLKMRERLDGLDKERIGNGCIISPSGM